MKKAAKKTASKKTTAKKEVVKTEEVREELLPDEGEVLDLSKIVEEEKEVKPELTEKIVEEEFIPDFEGVDSKPATDQFSESDSETFKKFINIYSPPVITKDNARLAKTPRGETFIKVSCDKQTEGSMPKFIDGLTVSFE
jgi:hypothetical protein